MIESISLAQLGALVTLLGAFGAVIMMAVKSMTGRVENAVIKGQERLEQHIDAKFQEVNQNMDKHSVRLDAHDKQLQAQQTDQLRLRNEILEKTRDNYVRHDDISDIKRQISALFTRLDKVIFKDDSSKGDRNAG